MALQSSGAISFSDISNEFGLPPGRNLGAYRVSQSVGSLLSLPLDTGVPQSGTIRFSDFYNKRLNVVVDCHSSGLNNSTRLNGRTRYINNNVTVIGNFRSRPSNSSGTKVFINANVDIGSVQDNDTRYVALRTGSWDSGTTLQVDVGGSGRLFGAGGNGGNANGGPGGNGTSALGIEYSGTTIINRGYIQCGFGGGGAGGSGSSDPNKNQQDAGYSGGGGGGGAGFPAGGGGSTTSSGVFGFGNSGSNGSGGTKTTRGAGGSGGFNRDGGGQGGAGGPGGDAAVGGASAGGGGSGNISGNPGGSAGSNGYAIVSSVGGSYSLSNFGTIVGGTVFTSVL